MKTLKKIAMSTMIVLSSITIVSAEYFIKSNFQAGMIQMNIEDNIQSVTSAFRSNEYPYHPSGDQDEGETNIEIKIIDKSKINESDFPLTMEIYKSTEVDIDYTITTNNNVVIKDYVQVVSSEFDHFFEFESSGVDERYEMTRKFEPIEGVEITYISDQITVTSVYELTLD